MGKGMKKQTFFLKLFLFTGIQFANVGVHSAPQVIVNTPSSVPTVAIASNVATTSPLQNPNQPTLAQLNQPNDSQLSQANKQLLVQNAELQRKVDSLTTQTNLLVHEKSSQLFIYGAFTAILSAILGFALSWFIFGRNKTGW